MQATLPAREQVERALQEVYSRPEFMVRPQRSPWEVLLKPLGRFLRWLSGLGDGFRGLEFSAPWLYWLIVGWLALTALAILAHLVYSALTAAGGRRRRPAAGEVEAAAAPRGATDWEAEARRAAAEGRMREAAIALYHAVLLRLDARGTLRFDPAKTPGDYRRELRREPATAAPFGRFLRGFEPVAFGGRPLDPDGYERLRAAAGETVGAHG